MGSLLKKISLNCQEATFTALRKEEELLTMSGKMKLYIHLLYCGPCRLFLKQTKMIEKATRNYKEEVFAKPTHSLSPEMKKSLQDKIDSLAKGDS